MGIDEINAVLISRYGFSVAPLADDAGIDGYLGHLASVELFQQFLEYESLSLSARKAGGLRKVRNKCEK